MTTEIALTLTIIVAALALFATEKLRVDLVALLVLLSVALLRLINPGGASGCCCLALPAFWQGKFRFLVTTLTIN